MTHHPDADFIQGVQKRCHHVDRRKAHGLKLKQGIWLVAGVTVDRLEHEDIGMQRLEEILRKEEGAFTKKETWSHSCGRWRKS